MKLEKSELKSIINSVFTIISMTTLVLFFQNCGESLNTANNVDLSQCDDEECSNSIDLTQASCTFNGLPVFHGESVEAYLNSTSESCSEVEERVCSNGELSGSYSFSSCSTDVDAKKSCLFDGLTISDSESITAYLNSSVSSGDSCSQEERICSDGELSGSYSYSSCNVAGKKSCLFDGKTVSDSSFVVAYESSSVPAGEDCVSQNRVCGDGELTGSYSFSSCEVDKPKACKFNGKTIAHGGFAYGYLKSSVPHDKTCKSDGNRARRNCDDGVLSRPQMKFASCKINKPKSCLLDGKTIAHDETVSAYVKRSESHKVKNACESHFRTCKDGKLSGKSKAKKLSCEVKYPSCKLGAYTLPHFHVLNYSVAFNNLSGGLAGSVHKTYSDVPSSVKNSTKRGNFSQCQILSVACVQGELDSIITVPHTVHGGRSSKCGGNDLKMFKVQKAKTLIRNPAERSGINLDFDNLPKMFTKKRASYIFADK